MSADAPEHEPRPSPPARRLRPEAVPDRPDLYETLIRFEAAHRRRAVDAMRACFHDEAMLESIASDGRMLDADETIAAIVDAFRDGVYAIGDWEYERLERDVFLSYTGARHLLADARMRDETVVRLIVGRDGLMWRAKLFPTRDRAVAHLERHGHDLGV